MSEHSPLWQLGKKRSRDTVLFVSNKVTNRKTVQGRRRVFIANREIVTTEVSALRSSQLRSPQKRYILLLNPYLLLLLQNKPCCPLMQTATVEGENLQKSRRMTTRLLLDTGSQRTYITNELAEKLQLPITGWETLTVYKFSTSKLRELHTPVTELRLLTKNGLSLHLRVNVVPKITGNLQRAYFNPKKFTHLLTDIPLADSIPSTKETANIELLLGNDYYCDIFSGDIAMKAVSPGLDLMESKLRWILTGRVKC